VSETKTQLERHLEGDGSGASSVTPIDALRAARRHFLRGERVDMQELASELGVSRATLYRWVGSREQLLGEVLWSVTHESLRQAKESATGDGVEWFLQIYMQFGVTARAFEPLRKFIDAEPEAAMRVMMSKQSPQQRRITEAYEQLLEEGVRERGIKPRLDVHTLAFALVRIGESFLWSDLITGERADLSKAGEVARVLLT
jgi:AcrR family transcriptional regulator